MNYLPAKRQSMPTKCTVWIKVHLGNSMQTHGINYSPSLNIACQPEPEAGILVNHWDRIPVIQGINPFQCFPWKIILYIRLHKIWHITATHNINKLTNRSGNLYLYNVSLTVFWNSNTSFSLNYWLQLLDCKIRGLIRCLFYSQWAA